MFIKILLSYLIGYITITVEGYYIERFINICRNKKIPIWNLRREKNVRLTLNIGINDFKKVIYKCTDVKYNEVGRIYYMKFEPKE